MLYAKARGRCLGSDDIGANGVIDLFNGFASEYRKGRLWCG